MIRTCQILLILSFTASAVSISAAKKKPDASLLTLDRIFVKREFNARGYSHQWLKGSDYTRLENADGGGKNIVRYRGGREKGEVMVPATDLIPSGSTTPLEIGRYSWSKDRSLLLIYNNSKRVWRTNSRGDYWLLDRSSGELRKLGGDAPASSLMFAKISPDNRNVAYVRDNDIWVEDLIHHKVCRLTEKENNGVINGTFDWVYEEEFGIRDGFRWSPNGESIAFWQIDENPVRKHTMIDNLVGLYPKTIEFGYPKVGQQNAYCRIGVVSVKHAAVHWINTSSDLQNNYIARMDWADNSESLLIQKLNRLQNTNEVILATVHGVKSTQFVPPTINRTVRPFPREARTSTTTGKEAPGEHVILLEGDKAWVNVRDETHWINGGKQFTWTSERDGWRHIYLVNRDGGKPTRVSSGHMDVIRLLHVDEKAQLIYFIASPKNPAERYLYAVGIDGNNQRRITPASEKRGTHSYSISPDGKLAFVTSSNADTPPVTMLVSLPEHKQIRVVADNDSLKKKVAKLKHRPAQFIYVDVGKRQKLHARLLSPPNFDKKKKYPLLVYVYGEPAGSTVRDSWGRSSHMWHMMLAQQGYFVITIDNHGTAAPRGRAWRKSIYRRVGIDAPKEQAAAIKKLLKDRPYIDPKRVGVWGWSGGGSMSLNAIFKYPEIYSMAMAIAPVPNQRHYDTIYQERYMGLPGDNVEGYREGSPIHFAHQLDGDLLIVHGTADDNCHYQTFEKLVDKLIQHNKPFTMMAYPNRTHSIREGRNTTIHLFSLMTRFVQQHLPAGAK